MKHRALKILFWILLPATVLGALSSYSLTVSSAINFVGSAISLFVIFGYSYEKALFRPVLWKIAFLVNLVIWLRALTLGINKAIVLGWGPLDIGGFVLVSAGLGLVVLAINFLYAFRCHGIWAQTGITHHSSGTPNGAP